MDEDEDHEKRLRRLEIEVAVLKSQMRFIGGIAVTVAGLVSLITLLIK